MFANFYMTPLDYYIKYTLGITLYGRYVDDFMMYGPKNLLLKSSKLIRNLPILVNFGLLATITNGEQ